MRPVTEFDVLAAAAAGMDAQRAALGVAARNVAAAETTDDSSAFERLVPRFISGSSDDDEIDRAFDAVEPPESDFAADGGGLSSSPPVRFVGTTTERGHSADAITEMVAVLNAQRAYEANASVFDLGKRLAERTIDLGSLR